MNTFTYNDFGLPNRTPPRPINERQPSYLEEFDDETLFYDIFFSNGKLIFLSPPIEYAVWVKILDNLRINSRRVNGFPCKLYKTKKTHKLIANITNIESLELFGIQINDLTRTNPHEHQRVLYTMQKDNKIEWIRTWINWHIEHHGVDHVIIYDNNSQNYSIDELATALADLSCSILIKSMPFKYGPGDYNGNEFWDSDYLQYFAFEHVRYAYCQSNAKLINCDIDEFMVSNQKSVFDIVGSQRPVCLIPGKWIYIQENNQKSNLLHASHNLLEKSSRCSFKWVADLNQLKDSVLLLVHEVEGVHFPIMQDTPRTSFFLHFRSVTTEWKIKRKESIQYKPEEHTIVDISDYKSIARSI